MFVSVLLVSLVTLLSAIKTESYGRLLKCVTVSLLSIEKNIAIAGLVIKKLCANVLNRLGLSPFITRTSVIADTGLLWKIKWIPWRIREHFCWFSTESTWASCRFRRKQSLDICNRYNAITTHLNFPLDASYNWRQDVLAAIQPPLCGQLPPWSSIAVILQVNIVSIVFLYQFCRRW